MSKQEDVPREGEPGPAKGGPSKPSATPVTDAVFLAGLSADDTKLLDYLRVVNGQDAYSNESAALGRLSEDEYLALPRGMQHPVIAAKDVGGAEVHQQFTIDYLARVYALNKARAPPGVNAVRYGLLRMEAVKCGWYNGQKEVIELDAPAGYRQLFMTDLAAERESLATARLCAYLQPLIACHTFLTFGHHYLTGLAADYEDRYKRTYNACLAMKCVGYLPAPVLYHHALHWVSPRRAREVWQTQLDTDRMPEAMRLRFDSAPAGAALVTTTDAVLKAMQAGGIYDKVKEASKMDLDAVGKASTMIRKKNTAFHKLYHAFGVNAPTAEEIEALQKAREVCIKLAAVSQGYIDSMFQDAALSRAKVLIKYADDNPQQRRRAERYFRELARSDVKKIGDVFYGKADE